MAFEELVDLGIDFATGIEVENDTERADRIRAFFADMGVDPTEIDNLVAQVYEAVGF